MNAIIFSQSEGCLFTLLIISFVVQKLLSFIRSHLFIFAFVIYFGLSWVFIAAQAFLLLQPVGAIL